MNDVLLSLQSQRFALISVIVVCLTFILLGIEAYTSLMPRTIWLYDKVRRINLLVFIFFCLTIGARIALLLQ